jgi:hypothetical protein
MTTGRSNDIQQPIDDGSIGPSVVKSVERSGRPSVAVVEALAALEGDEPYETEFVLRDFVDPDALDTLVTDGESITVEFVVRGYHIEVHGDGTVVASQLRPESNGSV